MGIRHARHPVDYFNMVPGEPPLIRAHAIYVGGTGTVVIPTSRGNVTFICPAGTTLEIEVDVALDITSTATGIVGLRYDYGRPNPLPRDPDDPTDPDDPAYPDNPTDPVHLPFPDILGDDDWLASEVRDPNAATASGFSDVTVTSTIPTGFRLYVYAGGRADVYGDWARVTRNLGDGEVFRTPVALNVGASVYPQAFWQRISDGSWARAGTKPSYVIQGLIPVVELENPIVTEAGGSSTASNVQPTTGTLLAGRLLLAFVGTTTQTNITNTQQAQWNLVDRLQNSNGISEVHWRIIQEDNENVGDWSTGRPRYVVVDNFDPDEPVRQVNRAFGTSGTTHEFPALLTPLVGNSAVFSFGFATTITANKGPGIRSDSTVLYQRTTASGLHNVLAVSATIPAGDAGDIWPAENVATQDGLTAGGWHAWSVEVVGGEGAVVVPGTDAQFIAALTPANDNEIRVAMVDAPMAYSVPAAAGNGEGNPSTPLYARHKDLVVGMAARAGVDTEFATPAFAGTRTPVEHSLWTLRWYLNGTPAGGAKGRAPACRAGYHAQYEVMLLGLIATALVTPAIWDDLTSTEKEKCDLIMYMCAVANACVGSDNSPFTGDWGSRRTIRGYSAGRNNAPNFSSPTRLIPHVAKRYFELRGGDSLQTRFNNHSRTTLAARLAPTGTNTTVNEVVIAGIGGLEWAYDTFRFPQWNNAVKLQMHTAPVDGPGEGPTSAQINAMLNGAGTGVYSCLGYDLTDTRQVFYEEIERVLSLPCAPGVRNQVGGVTGQAGWAGQYGINNASTGNVLRGCIDPGVDYANWVNIPHKGLIGMPLEIDTVDEGPRRSSMSYAFAGVSAVLAMTAIMVTMKAFSLNDPEFATARSRVLIGWDWIKYAINTGYRSYAKGGGNMSNNENFTLAYATANRSQNVLIPAWDYLVRAITTAPATV